MHASFGVALLRATATAFIATCAFVGLARAQLGYLLSPNADAYAVEYFHAGFGHYFVTSIPGEVTALDQGLLPGWQRTGESFGVFSQAQGPLLSSPVCRFFTEAFAPLSSHFYTPYASECELLKPGPVWQYEGVAYHVMLPNAQGLCMGGTAVLYRLYNDGQSGAPNHRYTRRYDVAAAMRANGWVAEGNGFTHAFGCVPAGPPPQVEVPFDGSWAGRTTAGSEVLLVILENKSAWVIHLANAGGIAHAVRVTQQLNYPSASRQARSFNYTDGRSREGVIVVGIAPKLSVYAYVSGEGLPASLVEFNASYAPAYESSAVLADIAGAWSGPLASTGPGLSAPVLTQPSAIEISAGSQITGVAGTCRYQGTIVPRASGKNVFDVNVEFGPGVGGDCGLAGRPFAGIAIVSSALIGGPTTLTFVGQGNTNQAYSIAWSGNRP